MYVYVFKFCFVYVIVPDPTEDQLSHVGLAECGLSTVFYAFLLCFYTEINTTTTTTTKYPAERTYDGNMFNIYKKLTKWRLDDVIHQ